MDKVKELLIEYWKFAAIGLAVFILGIYIINDNQSTVQEQTVEAVIEQQDEIEEETELEDPSSNVKEPQWIMVDVKGHVEKPGVYEVLDQSRVKDVIELAGGFTEDANTLTVNLAEKVTDQMIVFIGGEDDPIVLEESLTGTNESSEIININLATKDELMQLNSIGSVKADNIIQYREENGPFNSIDELMNVSGIGEKTFESLKENLAI